MYSIHILMISFKPFLFRLKSSFFNRAASDILISTRIYTLVRAARITSNPFVSLLPNRLIIHFSMRKKVFFMNQARQQDQNLWEQIQINRANKKIKRGRDISENWTFLNLAFLANKTNKRGYIISWWISELLGRAGFEPAQTYCQRIYSPPPLTARASTQEESILELLIIHDQLPFVVPYPQGKSNPRCLLEREMS